jgi:NRPS condensation-like uncharacterized protein
MNSTDVNALTEKKQKDGLSGNINVSTSGTIELPRFKALAKSKNVTVNDVILSAIMTGLHMTFQDINKETKVERPIPSHLNIIMPANIRFSFYPTVKQIKLENKFAAIPLRVPMFATMAETYKPIKAITA